MSLLRVKIKVSKVENKAFTNPSAIRPDDEKVKINNSLITAKRYLIISVRSTRNRAPWRLYGRWIRITESDESSLNGLIFVYFVQVCSRLRSRRPLIEMRNSFEFRIEPIENPKAFDESSAFRGGTVSERYRWDRGRVAKHRKFARL